MTKLEITLMCYSALITLILIIVKKRHNGRQVLGRQYSLFEGGKTKTFFVTRLGKLPKNFEISKIGSEDELRKLANKYPQIYLGGSVTAVSSYKPIKYMRIEEDGKIITDYTQYVNRSVPWEHDLILARATT